MTLLDRLDRYLDGNDLEAVWFARPNSFAWLTGGGDNVVDRAGDVGVAAVGYDGTSRTVVTNNIEAQRLLDEELDDIPVESVQWYESGLASAVESRSPTSAAADFDVPGFDRVEARELRQPLTDAQIDRYRSLSVDATAALESVLRDTSPSDTERSVAADVRGAIEAKGIGTPVVLVGGSERAPVYRHYTPSESELGDYALVSITVCRDGLYTSTTRTVAFDPPEWLEERHETATRVETTALAATQALGQDGGTAGDVFGAIRDAYAAMDWDGEWRNHHQGGAAGFSGREWIATPTHEAPVHLPMAYAWSPTVKGAKSEDTHVVTTDGIDTLTSTGNWPTTSVSAIDRDLAIERHDVLEL